MYFGPINGPVQPATHFLALVEFISINVQSFPPYFMALLCLMHCRSEDFTQALINRFDSEADDDDEDKDARISSLEKSLMKQEQLVMDLRRRIDK